MEVSRKQNIIIIWLAWHFYEAPAFLFSVWKNYLLFVLDYFSMPLLLSTLFSPWRKTAWSYSRKFVIGEYLGNIITNTFSRILGAILRLVLIIAGIMVELLVAIMGAAVMVCWILLPLICIFLIIFLFYA